MLSAHIGGVEDVGKQEVEEGPQLVEVVLERGASQQEAVSRLEVAHDERQLDTERTT